jgi:hypothetical protein
MKVQIIIVMIIIVYGLILPPFPNNWAAIISSADMADGCLTYFSEMELPNYLFSRSTRSPGQTAQPDKFEWSAHS